MKDKRAVILGCLILAVSPWPWWLILREARIEPFYVFRREDVVLQVCGGTALLLVIAELSGLVVIWAAARKVSRWWFAALPWLAVLALLSEDSIGKWLGDMAHSPAWRG